jgi:phospholipid/cholesterol/gamma-HCH transport system ATP-binding protein
MSGSTPILELIAAQPDTVANHLPPVPLDLELMPRACALIETRDASQAAEFADLCCGMLPIQHGRVRFLGRDWADTPNEQTSAMRGRIGRVHRRGTWIGYLGTDVNILLSQLHHARCPEAMLRDSAAELSRSFGLPGLPLTRPDALTAGDLVRAACVRAFIGQPSLLLLESPEQERSADLVRSLLDALAAAHDRQAASIWLTRSDAVWGDRSFPATIRLRLTDRGLMPVRLPP